MTHHQFAELGGQLRQNRAYTMLRMAIACVAGVGIPLWLATIWLSAANIVPAESAMLVFLALCGAVGPCGARLSRIEEVHAYKIMRRDRRKPCAVPAW